MFAKSGMARLICARLLLPIGAFFRCARYMAGSHPYRRGPWLSRQVSHPLQRPGLRAIAGAFHGHLLVMLLRQGRVLFMSWSCRASRQP